MFSVAVCGLFGFCLPLVILPTTRAADAGEIVAVAAKVAPGYARSTLPDGSFKAENYTFGEGGRWSSALRDLDFEKMHFLDVAQVIAQPLADQKYLPGRDPKKIKLLIMVYWGTTEGTGGATSSLAYQNLTSSNNGLGGARATFDSVPTLKGVVGWGTRKVTWGSDWGTVKTSNFGADANLNQDAMAARINEIDAENAFDSAMTATAMADRQRHRDNWQNAQMLGYDALLSGTSNLEFTALHGRHEDLISELEDNRYFVVLMAYDFQELVKNQKHKLLWETRYSIRQRGNDFSEQLEAMSKYASKYFGQDSHGLLRKPLPEGRVTLGKLEVGAVVPDKK